MSTKTLYVLKMYSCMKTTVFLQLGQVEKAPPARPLHPTAPDPRAGRVQE